MSVALIMVLIAPAGAAVLSAFGWNRVASSGLIAASTLQLAAAAFLAAALGWGHAEPVTALGDSLRVDALSAVMLLLIALVGLLASVSSRQYLAAEVAQSRGSDRGRRFYGILVPSFLAVMALAVAANNLGIMWVCIEATTIVTAFLVGHSRTRRSLEAAWKYVVIGSAGVALAFLGTVLVHFAAVRAGTESLNWTTLTATAGSLDPGVMKIATGLLFIGFGTKAGLAPMHSWLPDAHSQAPSPVSALMSGVLTAVALYAILRYLPICLPSAGEQLVRGLLTAAALLSLLVAASLLIGQRDFKRMLAYSTVENMGLMALGVAAGTTFAIAAVLLQMLGHGLTKSSLFITAGRIQQAENTTLIAEVRGLLARRPNLGALWGVGLIALLGLPPFAVFFAEIAILGGALSSGLYVTTGVAVVLLLVVYVAVARHGFSMVLGGGQLGPQSRSVGWADVPAWAAIGVCAAAGIGLAGLVPLLNAAAATVTGGN